MCPLHLFLQPARCMPTVAWQTHQLLIMGRIFEVRKATMFARWDRMAKQFTRIGKEIIIAVKAGGPEPALNPALRRCFQNARSVGSAGRSDFPSPAWHGAFALAARA